MTRRKDGRKIAVKQINAPTQPLGGGPITVLVGPDTKIVVYSAFIDDKDETAARTGASACVDKGTALPEVIDAMVDAAGGTA